MMRTSRQKKIFVGVGSLMLVLVAIPIHAFVAQWSNNGFAQHWFKIATNGQLPATAAIPGTQTIRYYLDQSAYSETNRENELEAVRTAFDQWAEIPGSYLNFEDAGFIEGEPEINLEDFKNVIYWTKDTTLVNGEKDDIRGRFGLTYRAFFGDYSVVESDIVFNGVNHKWFTKYDSSVPLAVSVEAIALHEIGHLIGLEHSTLGASTMVYEAQRGLNSQLDLSDDDRAFVQSFYPEGNFLSTVGKIRGQVTMGAENLHGAVIVLEDLDGNPVRGTVSRAKTLVWEQGFYEMTAVPPGDYILRVTPMPPIDAQRYLIPWFVINFAEFQDIRTDYLPSEPVPVSVTAAGVSQADVDVQQGEPAFRLQGIQQKVNSLNTLTINVAPTAVTQGEQAVWIGVYGENLPEDAVLSVRGSGVTTTLSQYRADPFRNGTLSAYYIQVSVDEDALPGVRSFELRQGDNVAYANGFIDVLPKDPDYNADGLNDQFQRNYFTRWTGPEASPDFDADGDGYTNTQEFEAGSDPTNASSTPASVVPPFALLSVEVTLEGASVSFQSSPGVKYQLYSRRDVVGDPWVVRGEPVTAQNDVTVMIDSEAGDDYRFYRIETVP
jgi:hypothetical protein